MKMIKQMKQVDEITKINNLKLYLKTQNNKRIVYSNLTRKITFKYD